MYDAKFPIDVLKDNNACELNLSAFLHNKRPVMGKEGRMTEKIPAHCTCSNMGRTSIVERETQYPNRNRRPYGK